jgi:5-formyltetrahydrofolate cyclo-ligase
VQNFILSSQIYAEATSLALYAPIYNEVQTDRLLTSALASGKKVSYPRLVNGRIAFIDVSDVDDLQPGTFSVPEPRGECVVAQSSLDLILVPGVAFDFFGHRIGYGYGCYDRALAVCDNAEFIGLAYSFQVVDRLPEEEHDIRLDYLATECEFVELKHKQ